jgi:hypothetical protein
MSYIDEDHYIYVKNNSISEEVCDYLIQVFENDASHLVYKGVTISGLSDSKITLDLKLSTEINKYDSYIFEELNSNINAYFQTLNAKYESFIIPLKNIRDTGYQMQKYISNIGVYQYHHDSHYAKHESTTQTRILTFIWYLNTVDEGGETEFFNGRIKIKPEKGKLLFFPSTWTFMHKGNMPISGNKYIVTGWLYADIW